MKKPDGRLLLSAISIIGLSGVSQVDFKLFAGMSKNFGFGFEDHSRALEYLINEGTVREFQGMLKIRSLKNLPWLPGVIARADAQTWQLMDNLPHKLWKFSPDEVANMELGSQGELFVMDELRVSLDRDLHEQIQHVSLNDDSLGYDIFSPSIFEARGNVRLEVKTSSRPGNDFIFYLSRNEFEVGCSVKNWFLVFVKVNDGIPALLGHLGVGELLDRIASDVDKDFKWQSVRGKIDTRELVVGLP